MLALTYYKFFDTNNCTKPTTISRNIRKENIDIFVDKEQMIVMFVDGYTRGT
jgi:hypothetical protein